MRFSFAHGYAPGSVFASSGQRRRLKKENQRVFKNSFKIQDFANHVLRDEHCGIMGRRRLHDEQHHAHHGKRAYTVYDLGTG